MKANENSRQWTLNLFKEAYGEEGANEKASQLILNHKKGNYRQEMMKALSDARNKIMPPPPPRVNGAPPIAPAMAKPVPNLLSMIQSALKGR